MPNSNRKNGATRRTRMRGVNRPPNALNALTGSTKAQRFETLLPRFNISTAAVGVNNNLVTVAQLMGGDLVGRYVKPVSVICRFYPYNQATTSGSHYSTQIQYSDVNNGNLIPMSRVQTLSAVDVLILKANFPFIVDWLVSSATTPILNLPVWAEALLAGGQFVDITIQWVVAQDNLV
jgi:hypothetical protein